MQIVTALVLLSGLIYAVVRGMANAFVKLWKVFGIGSEKARGRIADLLELAEAISSFILSLFLLYMIWLVVGEMLPEIAKRIAEGDRGDVGYDGSSGAAGVSQPDVGPVDLSGVQDQFLQAWTGEAWGFVIVVGAIYFVVLFLVGLVVALVEAGRLYLLDIPRELEPLKRAFGVWFVLMIILIIVFDFSDLQLANVIGFIAMAHLGCLPIFICWGLIESTAGEG